MKGRSICPAMNSLSIGRASHTFSSKINVSKDHGDLFSHKLNQWIKFLLWIISFSFFFFLGAVDCQKVQLLSSTGKKISMSLLATYTLGAGCSMGSKCPRAMKSYSWLGSFFCSSKITSCESKTGPLTLSVLTFANMLFVFTLRVLVKLGKYFALKKTWLDLNGWWRV